MKSAISSLKKLAKMHEELAGEAVSGHYLNKLAEFEKGLFNIVVLGEVKKGKSSFVNALLGVENLVPVDTGIATSCVYRVVYGEYLSYTVHFLPTEDGAPAREPLGIPAGEVASYGTEKGNPANEKSVDYIEITCPSEFLRSGFCLIDTPGLGGMYKAHRAVTYRYVTQADAVFFVTDHKAPFGNLECKYIKDVLDVTTNLYFVQTKVHSIGMADAQRRRENNLSIINENFPDFYKTGCLYFLLDCAEVFNPDADEDDLDDSGYPNLQSFCCDKMLVEKNMMSVNRLAQMWTPVLQRCRALLASRSKTLDTDAQEELEVLMKQAEKAKADFAEWKLNIKNNYLTPLKRLMDSNYQLAMQSCTCVSMGGAVHMDLMSKVNSCMNFPSLKKLLEGDSSLGQLPLKEMLLESLKSEFRAIVDNYAKGVGDGICRLTNEVTAGKISVNSSSLTDTRVMNVLEPIEDSVSGAKVYEQVRGASMGLSFGSTAGYVVGSIVGSVVPVVGTALGGVAGAAIGAVWGGVQGGTNVTEANLKQQKQSIISLLERALNVAGQEIVRAVGSLHNSAASEATESVEEYLRTEEASLQKEAQQLQSRAGISARELREAKTDLAGKKKLFNDILAVLFPG